MVHSFLEALQEHREDERQVAEMEPYIVTLRSKVVDSPSLGAAPGLEAQAAITGLLPLMAKHLNFAIEHLRHEENEFSPLLRKNVPFTSVKALVNKVGCPCEQWACEN